jgi:Domain of unknown function (DUF4062)
MNKPGQITAMISSTALDLPEHREQAVDACLSEEVFPIGMQHLPARDADGVRVSMEMVDKADIYIGIYATRYGWVPRFDNPEKISITEMEFNRALVRKDRGELKEILIFLMHEEHPILARDKEDSKAAQKKLKAFKQRACAGRGVLLFKSKEELGRQIVQSLAAFKRNCETGGAASLRAPSPTPTTLHPIPKPPAFYAEPKFIVPNDFVGRASQLKELSDWAKPDHTDNVLLFEAIGGNGKSMLTWEWTTKHATQVRSDWAGRFWYSFYEKGAIMADFCQRALAYMTGQPLEEFRKKKTAELREPLLAQLHAKPWLLILDGLERVLVAYHRIDAAEIPDEEANRPTDKIANRNPCDAIRDEDNDLLRALAAAAPSKILISSRLIPRVLLNAAGIPLPGVCPKVLPGLDDNDAEALLRSCRVSGKSAAIRRYLTTNCDNHPLVIGVLAGLINNYLRDRGNFDSWVADPDGGAKLDLARLDLIQRRNHILRAALDALPQKSAQLLSILALLSESVDYPTLCAFNPDLPPELDEVAKPEPPEEHWRWKRLSEAEKTERRKKYDDDLASWKEYESAVKARLASADYLDAPKKLTDTVTDLERRGLLQYDVRTRRYDLHPVVRGVAAGGMKAGDRQRYGQRVVDHFSSLPHSPYENAETLEDLRAGLNVVRTLLKLGRSRQAADAFSWDLSIALAYNVEAHVDKLSLLRAFFPSGWGELPREVGVSEASRLANSAATALTYCGELRQALVAYSAALRSDLERKKWAIARTRLYNISENLVNQNMLADALRVNAMILDLDTVREYPQGLFKDRLLLFGHQARIGRWAEAEATWQLLDPMGRSWSRALYRPGMAESEFALFQFWRGALQQDHLAAAERLTVDGKNREYIRFLHGLRGAWRLEQEEWELAAASFHEAVLMARQSSITDEPTETGLALAKFHLSQLAEPSREAERLAQLRKPAHRLLALLWLAIGDHEQAKPHALAAYKWAWADGEPYVNRYELNKTTELLRQMNVPIPKLPPYDPVKDEKLPWEDDVAAAIARLHAEKDAKKNDEEPDERPT